MLDLLIVNHNTKDKLARLLKEVSSHNAVQDGLVRVHVTDSGSTDESKEWLDKSWQDFGVDQYFSQPNIGYARSINLMAAASSGEFLCAMNADVWLSRADAIACLDLFYLKDVAVVGPKQMDEQGHIRHAGILGSNTKPEHRMWAWSDPRDSLARDIRKCVTVSGSAYFMRRSIWDELAACPLYLEAVSDIPGPGTPGAFLPTPHYFEETFYSYHAREHGYRVMYDGRVSIGHTWKGSNSDDKQLRSYFTTSQKIFRTACDIHGIERD